MNEKEQGLEDRTSEPPIDTINGQVMDVVKRCTLGTGEKGQDTSKILGQNRETLEKESILGGGNLKASQSTSFISDERNEEK